MRELVNECMIERSLLPLTKYITISVCSDPDERYLRNEVTPLTRLSLVSLTYSLIIRVVSVSE